MNRIIIFTKELCFVAANHQRLFFLLFIFSIAGVADIPTAPIYNFKLFTIIAYIVCISALKAYVLTLISVFLLRRNRLLRTLCILAIVLYGFIGLLNLTCYYFYGFGITRRLFIIIGQTNPREIIEFLPGLVDNISALLSSHTTYLMLILIIVAFFLIKFIPVKIFSYITISFSAIGGIMLIWFCSTFTYGRTANFICMRLVYYTIESIRAQKVYQQYVDRLIPFPHPDKVTSSQLADNVVLVIGESASRKHHSLYGYKLNTTPHLVAMRDSLFVFSNAIGSSAGTAGNMERIMTFKEDDFVEDDWFKYPGLVDLFNNAGYKTWFLSNQEKMGLGRNASGALASSANVVKYIGNMQYSEAITSTFDEYLLPYLRSALADSLSSKKFIILHLLGSHVSYKQRFPAGFGKISADDVAKTYPRPWLNTHNAQIIADYDNSIAYTDSLLKQIIEMTAGGNPAVVVYFSDHGEHVYDERDMICRDHKYVEVPLIVYTNESYRTKNPDIVRMLQGAQNRPVSTANIIYSLMTLTGTDYPLYNAANDFISPEFKPRKRNVDERVWAYD